MEQSPSWEANRFSVSQEFRAHFMEPECSSPQAQHGCHHDTKVKPEAATAVIELLMMGGKTPENMLSCKQTSG